VVSDSPLIVSRAPSRRTAGRRCRPQAIGVTLLGFCPLQRIQSCGFGPRGSCQTRHLASSAFRTLSTLYTPQPLPGLFHPGNAHGVPSTGPCTSPGSPNPSRSRLALLSFGRPSPAPPFGGASTRRATSEPWSSRRVVPRGPKPAVAVALLTFAPPGISAPTAWEKVCSEPVATCAASDPVGPSRPFGRNSRGTLPWLPCASARRASAACATASCGACAPERCPPRELAFPRCRGAGPPGVPHLIASSEPCDPCDPFR
jgi:hypothetical protein